MSAHARISRAFANPLILPLNKDSKYILISDCHRGTGGRNDNFLQNEYLYLAALRHYFQRGYTYLELGDGDELWENRSMRQIKEVHRQSFEILAKYYGQGRFYAVYGNHDMVKQKEAFRKKQYQSYFCEQSCREYPLCPAVSFYEGIVLKDTEGKKDIYLTHGHQADAFNSVFWKLSRFLVRYVWKPLEKIGVSDPTSAAKNYVKKKKSEEILAGWAREYGHLLIAGHTHHPMEGTGASPYFNTGSCVHPGSITGIEIENRCMTLVKWSLGTREDLTLYARREPLSGTVCIEDYRM